MQEVSITSPVRAGAYGAGTVAGKGRKNRSLWVRAASGSPLVTLKREQTSFVVHQHCHLCGNETNLSHFMLAIFEPVRLAFGVKSARGNRCATAGLWP